MMDGIIKITSDARFRLARSLMTSGGGTTNNSNSSDSLEGAIDIFASLLEETRTTCGETSLNAALCYYEYGNALFRAVVRRKPLDCENEKREEEDRKPPAKSSASAARKRSLDDDNAKEPDPAVSNKKAKMDNNNDDDEDDNDKDDIDLALDMLSTSFSIFDWHSTDDDDNTKTEPDQEGKQYSLSQIPRVLSTIGDIHSYCGKYGDAVDAYCRALPYRENAAEERQQAKGKGESLSVDDLKGQRLLVETYALVAEALLACKEGEDVVCANDEENEEDGNIVEKSGKNTEGKVLVAAKDRIDFAKSHYDTAREKLQDIVYQMGKMAAAKMDLGDEKKDIGYLVMMLVGIGNTLEPLKTKSS